ncbi:restriction endonuclease subunit S [Bradyrhizobium sp. HKCCYLS3013]|uniref:restriction endonuclease subunit S n=1 Tax=Bradyrhizobium sp. HKCCYLS3013 TaxID=3420735 RepID=UPI003EB75A8D
MNAERLMAHYEEIAEAPDAVARLRRFILDLAVMGKLVTQNPNDEPAIELLRRIAAKRQQLVDAGEVKVRNSGARSRDKTSAFACPTGWTLSNLGAVSLKITDGAHKTPTYVDKGVPFISVKDFSGGSLDFSNTRFIPKSEHELLFQRCDPRRGDILIGRIGTLGKAVLIDTDVEFSLFVSVGLIRFDHDNLDPVFFRLLLNSPFVEAEFDRIKIGGGSHTNKLNLGDLYTVALPVPPLAEQRRIVAKVGELMVLCDRLETARATREATRDRLAAVSLSRLSVPNSETFQSDARFALDALTALTARPDQIKQLRQSILNLAVRGKLVPQLAGRPILDLPPLPQSSVASSMDAAVFREFRSSLILPNGWQVAPLAQLAGRIVDCPHTTPNWTKEGVICVRTSQLRPGSLDLADPRFVSEHEYTERIERLEPKPGDILYSREGGILGVACRVPVGIRLCLGQRLMLIRAGTAVLPEFLEVVLNSPFITDIAKACTTGGAAPRVNMSTVRAYPIPVPPLSEQEQIIAELKSLMALCDRLEMCLSSEVETRARLLAALLAEALTPADDRELEAAE